ncbi:unnamed protein product [Linum tenue]|uniref:Methyltransferase type 11 domain-containing protein n=1 Tax=Linum tenue TaxID=586396 RepID=A0AAV0MHA6_9ROSI|nr:unnamed protein product [Linum tenue]
MASAAIGGKLSSALLPGSNHNSCLVRVVPARQLAFRRRLPARLLLASSASSVETTLMETIVAGKEVSGGGGDWDNILACPICYRPLSLISDGLLTVDSASRASLECSCCRKTYYGKETHVELIAASGAKTYENPMPLATEFFRLPLISFIYERGWRQNFVFGGFPGAEKEFELLKNYVKPVLGGGNIVDASCGSGLFSRLFAKSGLFSLVVALDYSENMLKQ